MYSRSVLNILFPSMKASVVDSFHKLYYDEGILGKTWSQNRFLGVLVQKCPFELLAYQDILYKNKPDLIIETGTAYGGSAYFMASICDILNTGQIVTVDVADFGNLPKHKRIKYIRGSSVDPEVIMKLAELVKNAKKVMVILDSNHSYEHVIEELKLYNGFVTKGQYLIVEDTNVNGHPVRPEHGPGPMEALVEFLQDTTSFETDSEIEPYLSFNPKGYLKKVN